MLVARIERRQNVVGILEGVALLLFVGAFCSARLSGGSTDQPDPWSASQVVQPADLAGELRKGTKPEIVCVGVGSLYRSAHISGAAYHGPTSKPEGLEDLKRWAKDIP